MSLKQNIEGILEEYFNESNFRMIYILAKALFSEKIFRVYIYILSKIQIKKSGIAL